MSYRPELPAITRVSRRQLEALAFGSAYPAAVRPAPPAIHGLYNFENETIYLAHGIDLNGTQGRAIVLHELVHHLQYEYGFDADVRCVNELEPLAYEIEALYLGERQQPIGFSRAHVRRLSRCAASQRTSAAMRLPRERIAFQ